MEHPGEWVTAPTESDTPDKAIIFVTGRTDVEKFFQHPKYKIRIDVTMTYSPTVSGMPDNTTGETLEMVTDRLVETFHRDPIAILTGIYTGAGERNWVFYVLSTNIFQRKFNEALDDLPTLPITITAENDPHWQEYSEMRSILADIAE